MAAADTRRAALAELARIAGPAHTAELLAWLPPARAHEITEFRRTLALRTFLGDNIPQRTPAWYARRGHCVGGSQSGQIVPVTALGVPLAANIRTLSAIRTSAESLCKARRELRMRAVALAHDEPLPQSWWNVPVVWGTVLEPLTEELVAVCGALAPPAVAMQSCGSVLGQAPCTAFSADGVGVIDWGYWRRFAPVPDPGPATPRLTLLEYKNPWSTALPDKPQWGYEAQILAGLAAFPDVQGGMLLQAMWRRAPSRALVCPRECNLATDRGTHLHPGSGPAPDERRRRTRCPGLVLAAVPAYGWTEVAFRVAPAGRVHALSMRSPLQGSLYTWTSEDEPRTPADQRKMTRGCLRALRLAAAEFPVEIPQGLAGRGSLKAHAAQGVLDIGAAPHVMLAEVLWLCSEGVLVPVYSPLRWYARGAAMAPVRGKKFSSLPGETGAVVAVLPLKLFDLRTHFVDAARAPAFRAQLAQRAPLARAAADYAENAEEGDADGFIMARLEAACAATSSRAGSPL